MMRLTSNWRTRLYTLAIALGVLNVVATSETAVAAEPIKIGFSMGLTGAYAGNGKAALLATQMWAEDQNAKGGLLRRPIQLIYYDDQSNPTLVPGIYTKLFDVDKVDLVISGYGTNIIGPAMPLVMQRNKVFMSLAGLRVNEQFRYDKYFQIFSLRARCSCDIRTGFLRCGHEHESEAEDRGHIRRRLRVSADRGHRRAGVGQKVRLEDRV